MKRIEPRRNKIGLLTTSGNDTAEFEWNKCIPSNTSIHTVRMFHDSDLTDRNKKRKDMERVAKLLAGLDIDVAVYGCTIGSCIKPDSTQFLEDFLTSRLSVPAITTSTAVQQALDHLEAKSVAVSSPYTPSQNELIERFLTESGFDVVNIDNAGAQLDTAYEEGILVDVEAADSVFISCMNHPTFISIENLEQKLGKPVVTSNQASLWTALRLINQDKSNEGPGQLFRN